MSLPAVTPRLYSSDEVQYFSYLRSLWFDHDVSFENEYRYFYDRNIAQRPGFHETFLELQTAGRRLNFGTMGAAILWAPFYALGDMRRASRCARPGKRSAGRRLLAAVHRRRSPTGRRSTAFVAVLLSIARRATGHVGDRRSLVAGARRLARHAAALLHVRGAAVFACLLGVRRGALRHVWLHVHDLVAARHAALGTVRAR